MDRKRPRSRDKYVTGGGSGVHRRGEGRGTGPVGTGHGPSGGGDFGGSGGKRSGGQRGLPIPAIIILLIALLGGGGGLGSGLLGGLGGGSSSSGNGPGYYSSISGGQNDQSGWTNGANTGKLNERVSSEARPKYQTIKGGGEDTVTIMVYMCGTDLESRSGMATKDLSEMAKADIGKKMNVIVYTGGCNGWRNNIVSSKVNQIYQVTGGGLRCLEKNMGTGAMTSSATLTEFIKWGKKHFPADRNELIFWDHGGGSISGYGYDEKNPRSGSMTLSGINTALNNAGMKFDFIGFDCCLMATVENAKMLSQYADYMIASEETEPGVGWYYTNWLSRFSADTSMSTLQIGKNIVDDFVSVCNQKCAGQQTTLSVVDLAELQETFPDDFTAFAKDTRELIKNNNYSKVSAARSVTREFARSSRIDQIDLVHFAKKMETAEGDNLAQVLLDAVKYNMTSRNMTNAYGLSVYFPYQQTRNVDKAVKINQEIGVDNDFSECIREFASMEVGGQIASGGTTSPAPSLFDFSNLVQGSSGQSSSGQSSSGPSSSDIADLLGLFMGGSGGINISGLNSGNMDFFTGKSISDEDMAAYIGENQFDASKLVWQENSDGQQVISLDEDQWNLVTQLDLNMFYDDGEGYVDLGLDNVFDFDEDGNLLAGDDKTWVSINGKPVAYYHLDTTEDGDAYTITGRVPAVLNGEDVQLILMFDNEHPKGYVAGARTDYDEKDTETVARGLTPLKKGDKIDFLCDFYDYNGKFIDNYELGERFTVPGDMDELVISNTNVGKGDVKLLYRFTDIYNQHYWSEPAPAD